MAHVRTVAEEWESWSGSMPGFARDLDRRGVPYLSYSKLSTLEACEQRYYLEYVKRVRIRPTPAWAVRGRVFHEAAARVFRARAKGRKPRMGQIGALVEREVDDDDRRHLENAIETLLGSVEEKWEVVAVEAPFVLDPGDGLPPVLGIIDLVLRNADTLAVVDHKTCRTFGNPAAIQLALYREHVRREYGVDRCLAWFDEYRWVNNLQRIRKPATRRTLVRRRKNEWRDAKRRLEKGHARMESIRKTGEAEGEPACYPCPFKDDCSKAEVGGSWWW